MARDVHDREDLLRDARALVRRAQLAIGPSRRELFAGFRDGGALSVYFGSDPVYHFNNLGRLRRAYVDDHLIKAEKGKLVSLTRERVESAVNLVRHELTPDETQTFCETAERHLSELRSILAERQYELVGAVPAGAGVPAEVAAWLDANPTIKIASSPRVQ